MRRMIVPLALVVLWVSCGQKPPKEEGSPGSPARPAPVEKAVAPASAFAHQILDHDTPGVVQADSAVIVTVRVKNTSNRTWPAGGPIKLGYYWLGNDGARLEKLEGRGICKTDILPGDTAAIRVQVKAPAAPGTYLVVWDMVEEHVAWFGNRGAAPLKVPVTVQ